MSPTPIAGVMPQTHHSKSPKSREQRYSTRSTNRHKQPDISCKPNNIMASGSSMAGKHVPVINESDMPSGSIENKVDFLITKVLAKNNDTSKIIENQVQQMTTLTDDVTKQHNGQW